MVVLDSSAIIPLLRIGRVKLIPQFFPKVLVPRGVWREVVEEGRKLGKSVLDFEEGRDTWYSMAEPVKIEECRRLALSEGIHPVDAEVLLLAQAKKDILLTNDAALHLCCRSHHVRAWWLTTLLLASVKTKKLSKKEAEAMLWELVTVAKMHLGGELLGELITIIRNL